MIRAESVMSRRSVSHCRRRRWTGQQLGSLVTAVQNDDSHLKSLDMAGSETSSVDWTSLLVELSVNLMEGPSETFEELQQKY